MVGHLEEIFWNKEEWIREDGKKVNPKPIGIIMEIDFDAVCDSRKNPKDEIKKELEENYTYKYKIGQSIKKINAYSKKYLLGFPKVLIQFYKI